MLSILNFYADPALLKDGLNLDDRSLKTIAFVNNVLANYFR